LTTWIKDLKSFPERPEILRLPSYKPPTNTENFEVDVLIIGAGNSQVAQTSALLILLSPSLVYRGLIQATRLKALGIKYLCIDKNVNIGDNWALRYES
jgi:hypothetical protein